MGNSKLILAVFVGILFGVIGYHFYINLGEIEKPPSEGIEKIDEEKSRVWFDNFMHAKFSDIDTSQEVRTSTRIKRVEFTQETLSELIDINQQLREPEVLRLYFGKHGDQINYMVMAFDSDDKSKSESSMLPQGRFPRNQTGDIFVVEGHTPICPDQCDREGPY